MVSFFPIPHKWLRFWEEGSIWKNALVKRHRKTQSGLNNFWMDSLNVRHIFLFFFQRWKKTLGTHTYYSPCMFISTEWRRIAKGRQLAKSNKVMKKYYCLSVLSVCVLSNCRVVNLRIFQDDWGWFNDIEFPKPLPPQVVFRGCTIQMWKKCVPALRKKQTSE